MILIGWIYPITQSQICIQSVCLELADILQRVRELSPLFPPKISCLYLCKDPVTFLINTVSCEQCALSYSTNTSCQNDWKSEAI